MVASCVVVCGIAFVTKRTNIGSSAIARSAAPDKKWAATAVHNFSMDRFCVIGVN